MFKVGDQQGPAVEHRELCSMFRGSLGGRGGGLGRMHTCVCMAECLCWSPEAITTLLSAILQCKIKSVVFFLF